MKETLSSLLELAKIDGRITQLKEEHLNIPKIVKEESREIQARQKELDDITSDIESKKSTQKQLHAFVEEKNQWVLKREEQIREIKTNKEYQAALKEISHAKKEIRDKEAELGKIGPELDSQVNTLKSLEEKNKPVIETLKSSILEKKGRFEEIKSEIDRESKGRVSAAHHIANRDILKYYEKVHGRLAPALSKVGHDCICTECGTQLLPQTFNLLVVGEKIQVCNGCKRILVLEESKTEEPA